MIFAPHPDDEALGTGGLLQLAAAAGAAVRLVFITDGDNNPWPQRWMEKRWFINAACRRRWGMLRRVEALRSLKVLGWSVNDAQFLGYPDQGMLPLWRRRDAAVRDRLSQIIADWQPTVLVVPSDQDRHPDHRGVSGFAREAALLRPMQPDQYSYLIHRGFSKPEESGVVFVLTPEQQRKKLQAILCHETQTSLSRRRFCSYARPEETFTPLPRAESISPS